MMTLNKYQAEMKHVAVNGSIYRMYPINIGSNTKVSIGACGNESQITLSTALKNINEKFETLRPVGGKIDYISTVSYTSTASVLNPSVKGKQALKSIKASTATRANNVISDVNGNILLRNYLNKTSNSFASVNNDYKTSIDSSAKTTKYISGYGLTEMFNEITNKYKLYYTTADKISTAKSASVATNGTVAGGNETSFIDVRYYKKTDTVNVRVDNATSALQSLVTNKVDYDTSSTTIRLINGLPSKMATESQGFISEDKYYSKALKFGSSSLIPFIMDSDFSRINVYNDKNLDSDSISRNSHAISFIDNAKNTQTGGASISILTVSEDRATLSIPFELQRTVIFIVGLPVVYDVDNHENIHILKDGGPFYSSPGFYIHLAGSYDVSWVSTAKTGTEDRTLYRPDNMIYVDGDKYKFTFNIREIAGPNKYGVHGWNVLALIV